MNKIGIIGGTGLYDIEGFTDREEIAVNTPFGDPSDRIVAGIAIVNDKNAIVGGVPDHGERATFTACNLHEARKPRGPQREHRSKPSSAACSQR